MPRRDVTVASWNIHWGRGSKFRHFPPFDVVEGCRRLDADVLVLQECWGPDGGDAQQDVVAEALGYEVRSVALARAVEGDKPGVVARADDPDRPGDGDWSLAVLSRLPIVDSAVLPLPQLRMDPCNRALLRADLVLDGAPLTVFGAHMPHLHMGSPRITGPLRAHLGPADGAKVLIGDMNMWSWCISAMAPPGWRRVGRGRTYSTGFPHSRIDHLVHTPAVAVDHIEVVRDRGSDHLPIRARVRIDG